MGWPVVDPDSNIVLVATTTPAPTLTALAEVGVRAVPFGPGIRFVTHRDVGRADVEDALERIRAIPAPS